MKAVGLNYHLQQHRMLEQPFPAYKSLIEVILSC